MKKDIVLIVGGFNLPNNNASAVRALGLAKLLVTIQYKPIISGVFTNNKTDSWVDYDGFRCFNMKSADAIATDISFMKEIEKCVPSESIYAIVAYNYAGIALLRLFNYAKSQGIKMVSDTTEWYGWELSERGILGSLVRKFHTELRMRVVNRKIKNLICSTYYISEYYKGCHTMVLPMVDDNSFIEKNEIQAFRVNTPRRFFYAGSPGFKFRKDKINLAISLFEKLDKLCIPFQFDIYGISESDYCRYFDKPIVKTGSIVFHGRVPRAEIIEELPKMDFYVLLRPNNKVCKVGFSTKAMEAISYCVPLIANDVNGDFSKYFNKGQALLCKPTDLNGFYELLYKACIMPNDSIVNMKNACQENNPFHYKKYVEPMKSFMGELL